MSSQFQGITKSIENRLKDDINSEGKGVYLNKKTKNIILIIRKIEKHLM